VDVLVVVVMAAARRRAERVLRMAPRIHDTVHYAVVFKGRKDAVNGDAVNPAFEAVLQFLVGKGMLRFHQVLQHRLPGPCAAHACIAKDKGNGFHAAKLQQ